MPAIVTPPTNAPADASVDSLLHLLRQGPAVLVRVESTEGSAPREAGAWMAVAAGAAIGTIGGGHLEWQALAEARTRLVPDAEAGRPAVVRHALGPALGQCCGGVVWLRYARITSADADWLAESLTTPRAPVALFGGGHVGHALVRALAPLPFAVQWIDSRDGVFPMDLPPQVGCEHSEPVHGAVDALAAGSRVVIMSFSHAEDLDILAACLRRRRERADLPYIGMIGSRTKRMTFEHRLEARGFGGDERAGVVCPIGVPGIVGKQPAVIAAAVAAQLLQTL